VNLVANTRISRRVAKKIRPLVEENEKVIDENDTSGNTVENAEISTKNVVPEGPDEKTQVQTIDPTEIKKLNNETESDCDDSDESEYETDSQTETESESEDEKAKIQEV